MEIAKKIKIARIKVELTQEHVADELQVCLLYTSNINGGKMNKEKTNRVLEYFDELFPDAYCELNHESDFQLLVAVMLSAQTLSLIHI